MSDRSIPWRDVLTLNSRREAVSGSASELRRAIGRGADLRIYSEFRHNEHIDTSSANDELIRETMDMRATYLVDGRWAAGVITLRQPVQLPDGFGPRPSLSLFLYNEDGGQAIARPHLDGPPQHGDKGSSPVAGHDDMPRYHEHDAWDVTTNAPSSNFVYDFDCILYFVREDWTEALHHGPEGEPLSGSIETLTEAFARGAEVKVGIRGLCADLAPEENNNLDHEIFVQTGSCYYYTRQKLLIAATHPVARVAPAVPLRYRSGNWDYGWLVVRTDGHVARLLYDPYTLVPARSAERYEMRWFYR